MNSRTWLLNIRNNKGKTQDCVAESAGIERAYYTQIETGVRNPSVTVAKAIAAALEFDWVIFFSDDVAICDNEESELDGDRKHG